MELRPWIGLELPFMKTIEIINASACLRTPTGNRIKESTWTDRRTVLPALFADATDFAAVRATYRYA